jgi:hypothetical protein
VDRAELTPRPLNERTVADDLLAAVERLSEELAAVQERLDIRHRDPSNWWDVLDPLRNPNQAWSADWSQIFQTGYVEFQVPKKHPSSSPILRWYCGADRIELTLLVDQVIIWQRALFFSPPFGGS